MALYKLKTIEKEDYVKAYARDPKHLVELIELHRGEANRQGVVLDDPRLFQWIRKVPTAEDILLVEKGELHFHQGGIDFSGDGSKPFFEVLQVAPDFAVLANEESLPVLEQFICIAKAPHMLEKRRKGNLYRIYTDSPIFPCVGFVPKDIMDAILNYDLKPHLKKARERLNEIARTYNRHPNLRI